MKFSNEKFQSKCQHYDFLRSESNPSDHSRPIIKCSVVALISISVVGLQLIQFHSLLNNKMASQCSLGRVMATQDELQWLNSNEYRHIESWQSVQSCLTVMARKIPWLSYLLIARVTLKLHALLFPFVRFLKYFKISSSTGIRLTMTICTTVGNAISKYCQTKMHQAVFWDSRKKCTFSNG